MNKVSEKLRRKSKETQSAAPTGSIIGVDGGKKGLALPGKNKKVISILAVIILVIVIVIGLIAYRFLASEEKKPSDAGGCSQATIQKAAKQLNPGSLELLKPLAEDMAADPGYAQNPNCLYILTIYGINKGDPQSAREYFKKLEAVYKPETGYDKAIAKNELSNDELRASIDFMESQHNEVKQNSRGVPVDGQ